MNELKEIVERMIAAGESEENIALVIKTYKQKNQDSLVKMESPVEEVANAGLKNQAADGVSPPEDGSLDLVQIGKPITAEEKRFELTTKDGSNIYKGSDILNEIKSLKFKISGEPIYNYKDGKIDTANPIKSNVSDQDLLDLYVSKFNGRVKEIEVGIDLDEAMITGKSKRRRELEAYTSKLNELEPTEEELNAQADYKFSINRITPSMYSDPFLKKAAENVIKDNNLTEFYNTGTFGPVQFLAGFENGIYAQEAFDKAKEPYKQDLYKNTFSENLENYYKETESFFDKSEAAKMTAVSETLYNLDKKRSNKISNEINIIDNELSFLAEDLSSYKNKYFDTTEEIEEAKIEYNQKLKKFNNLANIYSNKIDYLYEIGEDLNKEKIIFDAAKKDYTSIGGFIGNTIASTSELISGAISVPSWLEQASVQLIADASGVEFDQNAYEALKKGRIGAGAVGLDYVATGLRNFSKEIRDHLPTPKKVEDISSLGGAVEWGIDLTANQLPQMGVMIFAPGASLGVLAGSAAGNKYLDMAEEMSLYKEKYKGWQMLSAPMIVGGVEYLTERVSVGQLKKVRNIFNKMDRNSVVNAAEKYIADNVLSKNYFVDMGKEAGAETIAALSENITDIYLLGKSNVNIFDGVPDAAISGAFMSGVIYKAPAVGAKMLRPFESKDNSKLLRDNVNQILNLQTELAKPNISSSTKLNIENLILKLTKANNEILKDSFNNIDYLSNEDKNKLINIEKEKEDLKIQYRQTLDADDISKENKSSLIKDIAEEFFILENEKKSVLTKAALIKETGAIEKGAEQIFKGKVKVIRLKDATAVEEWLDKNSENYTDLKDSKDLNVKRSKQYGFEVKGGKNGERVLIINEKVSAEEFVSTTARHEFLHSLLANTLTDPSIAIDLGLDLIKEIKLRTDGGKQLSPKFLERISLYAKSNELSSAEALLKIETVGDLTDYMSKYLRDSNGKINAIQFEELITLTSESLASGDLKLNDSALTKFAEVIKRIYKDLFGIEIKFNTGKDVLEFIKDYNKSVDKGGKFSSRFEKLAEKGAKGKLTEGTIIKTMKAGLTTPDTKLSRSRSQVEQAIESLEERLYSGEISDDYFETKLSSLEKELEEAKQPQKRPKDITDKIKSGAQKILDENKQYFIDNNESRKALAAKKIAKLYMPLMRKYATRPQPKTGAAAFAELEGFNMESYMVSAETELVRHIMNFNPDKNDDIHGWVNSQAYNKALNALKSEGIDLTAKSLEGEGVAKKAEKIAAEETASQETKLPPGLSFTAKIERALPKLINNEVRNEINEIVERYITSDDVLKKIRFEKFGNAIVIQPEEQKAFRKMVEETFVKEYAKKFQKYNIAVAKRLRSDEYIEQWQKKLNKAQQDLDIAKKEYNSISEDKNKEKKLAKDKVDKLQENFNIIKNNGQRLGTSTVYKQAVENTYDLYKIMPQSFINKKIPQWAEPDIDPKTGKQRRETVSIAGSYGGAVGNPIFVRKFITKDEWINYWLPIEAGASTRAARRTRFSEFISQELGKDSFLTFLNNPETRQKFLDQQRMPAIDEIEALGITLATALDRNPEALGIKYSMSPNAIRANQTAFEKDKTFAANIADLNKEDLLVYLKEYFPKEAFGFEDSDYSDAVEFYKDGNKNAIRNAKDIKKDFIIKADITEQKSKELEKYSNEMLERVSGISAKEKISPSQAALRGKSKGRFDIYIPPNTEDFTGLIYKLYGKGEQGNKDMAFIKENLLDPFARGERAFTSYKQRLAEDLDKLTEDMKSLETNINKETIKTIESFNYSVENAVRVYIWTKLGYNIPELNKSEQTKLKLAVLKDPKLKEFAESVMQLTKLDVKYPEPSGKDWTSSNIKIDLYEYLNKGVRSKFLSEWKENVDAIFNENFFGKLEAAFGKNYVSNLQKMLKRMESGKNVPFADKEANKLLDYINGSIGNIMFLNTRSAVLQTISSINFINWGDNNIIKAGATLKDPKKFIKTFMELMNSDYLKQRRNGLQIDVNESELAEALEGDGGGFKSVFRKLIKLGYKPTQIADSFAIALGGTSFYINRTNTYINENISEKEAKDKAFLDFQEIAEESQQSARTDRVSNIQAGLLGRLIFAFANTPLQYARLSKKAFLDIKNGRGDLKTNLSALIYYSFVQNVIFYALQSAMFATLFGADEEEEKNKKLNEKISRGANSILDGFLRSAGLYGVGISVTKNAIIKYFEEQEKGWAANSGNFLVAVAQISPPIGSKAQRINSWFNSEKYYSTKKGAAERDKIIKEKGQFFDPLLFAQAKSFGAATNIPVDRLMSKAINMEVALDDDINTISRIAAFLGWDKWSLGLYDKKSKPATTSRLITPLRGKVRSRKMGRQR